MKVNITHAELQGLSLFITHDVVICITAVALHLTERGTEVCYLNRKKNVLICVYVCLRGKSPGLICDIVFPESLLTISFGQGGNVTEYQ